MGYTHALVFDHVLGANPIARAAEGAVHVSSRVSRAARPVRLPGGRDPPSRARHRHPDPSAAAGRARGQAGGDGRRALRGRLRLGVAVGWNPASSKRSARASRRAASASRSRSRSCAPCGRRSWCSDRPVAQHPRRGNHPLPVQRPIPIWMGGESEVVVRRAARVADGWMPHFRPGSRRRPSSIGFTAMSRKPDARRRASASRPLHPGAGSAGGLGEGDRRLARHARGHAPERLHGGPAQDARRPRRDAPAIQG